MIWHGDIVEPLCARNQMKPLTCNKDESDYLRETFFDSKFGVIFVMRNLVLLLAIMGTMCGCENMTTSQKGALTGAALGSGIGMVAGGTFGQVVGAGLIGGAAGYVTGSAIEDRR